jgi:hypothetical protein
MIRVFDLLEFNIPKCIYNIKYIYNFFLLWKQLKDYILVNFVENNSDFFIIHD